jgi:Tfp pilus assembly protein PilX
MKHNKTTDQRGIVSIIVTMIMMIVITLIVLGFTQVARRNEREALDSQLGTQAYYAAESGVNAAQSLITADISSGTALPTVTDCKGTTGLTVPLNLKADGSVAYTCVMINPGPGSLLVNNVTQTTSAVLHAQNSKADNFKTLTFKWSTSSASSGSCSNSLGAYPIAGGAGWNCNFGILRVDILKATGLANYAPTTLANNTASLYLQPSTSNSANMVVGFGANTKAYRTTCLPASGFCSVTIDVSASSSGDYYVRLSTIYADAPTVEITGKNASDNSDATFQNGQVVIDATGRAQDQIKRIQVRIPVAQANSQAPSYGLMSTGEICKDLGISTVTSVWDAGTICPNDVKGWPTPDGTRY